MKTRLRIILRDVKIELGTNKRLRPQSDLESMIRDAPPIRDFAQALRGDFGLIAEIKAKSPSAGAMRDQNVKDTSTAYESSKLVKAVSVLTNKHFGMSTDNLFEAKTHFSKPILRKDFILDEYQVFEARAFGADAILLMGNILDKPKLHALWKVAKQLGMDVLFEAHTRAEIKKFPADASICGVNCRLMDTLEEEAESKWRISSLFKPTLRDTDTSRFGMIRDLPQHAIKVAESGVGFAGIKGVKERGYDAALVGTALLTDPEGVSRALAKFGSALSQPVGVHDTPMLVHATT